MPKKRLVCCYATLAVLAVVVTTVIVTLQLDPVKRALVRRAVPTGALSFDRIGSGFFPFDFVLTDISVLDGALNADSVRLGVGPLSLIRSALSSTTRLDRLRLRGASLSWPRLRDLLITPSNDSKEMMTGLSRGGSFAIGRFSGDLDVCGLASLAFSDASFDFAPASRLAFKSTVMISRGAGTGARTRSVDVRLEVDLPNRCLLELSDRAMQASGGLLCDLNTADCSLRAELRGSHAVELRGTLGDEETAAHVLGQVFDKPFFLHANRTPDGRWTACAALGQDPCIGGRLVYNYVTVQASRDLSNLGLAYFCRSGPCGIPDRHPCHHHAPWGGPLVRGHNDNSMTLNLLVDHPDISGDLVLSIRTHKPAGGVLSEEDLSADVTVSRLEARTPLSVIRADRGLFISLRPLSKTAPLVMTGSGSFDGRPIALEIESRGLLSVRLESWQNLPLSGLFLPGDLPIADYGRATCSLSANVTASLDGALWNLSPSLSCYSVELIRCRLVSETGVPIVNGLRGTVSDEGGNSSPMRLSLSVPVPLDGSGPGTMLLTGVVDPASGCLSGNARLTDAYEAEPSGRSWTIDVCGTEAMLSSLLVPA